MRNSFVTGQPGRWGGVVLACFGLLVAQARGGLYEFIDLGAKAPKDAVGLSPYFYGAALNDHGEVVFNVATPDGDYRALEFDGTAVHWVPTLAAQPPWTGRSNAAADINIHGAIVGHSRIGPNSAATHAFWCRDGVVTDIGPPDRDYSEAVRINDRGDVLGTSVGAEREFWVRSGGRLRRLAELIGPGTQVADMNNKGHVLGLSRRGVFIHDLDTGSTSYLDGVVGAIAALNDNDEVVSVAHDTLYRWRRGHEEELGTIGGGIVLVRRINTLGDIVGTFRSPTGSPRAFLYSGGQLSDLNALVDVSGWVLTSADAVNNRGEIVGGAVAADGSQRAYLLRPQR